MRLTASAAVAIVAILSACGDARDVDEGGGGGGAMHPIPFAIPQHMAAARASVASCTPCHGAELDGGAGAQTSCNDCHADAAGANFADDWRDNCTFCHGTGRDPAWSGDLAAVAPPQSAGGAAPQDNTNRKVGAHQAHLTAGTFSNPFSCDSCHTVPPFTFAGGSLDHVNGVPDVEFSTTAVQGVTSPRYSRANGTCAVYCHGSTAALGNSTSPVWTSTGIACGDCHPTAPTTGFHALHITQPPGGQGVQCVTCHPGYSETTVDPATHVNGTFEAVITANPAATPPTTNGTFAAWPASCTPCHPDL
jgi:predicted CxxxxCH...CXXCH cytochrome family protein